MKENRKIGLNPNVSVDCVVFGFQNAKLKVLLMERNHEYEEGEDSIDTALPGDLIKNDENLNEAATRVLGELTGLDQIYLEQFAAFGDPSRLANEGDQHWLEQIRENPEARVITIGYFSLIRPENFEINVSSFAKNAGWYALEEVPNLAFDHNEILQKGLKALKNKLRNHPIGFELLPRKFTLGQLQQLYEIILDTELDKRNFRRKILKLNFLEPLAEKQSGVAHKPAKLYRFDKERYESLPISVFDFQ
ncbi:MAG: 8-oxo-dGTP diphosphatase [Bacteroidia bacterium]|jgi:8-oxo-dGTP diphosphatase